MIGLLKYFGLIAWLSASWGLLLIIPTAQGLKNHGSQIPSFGGGKPNVMRLQPPLVKVNHQSYNLVYRVGNFGIVEIHDGKKKRTKKSFFRRKLHEIRQFLEHNGLKACRFIVFCVYSCESIISVLNDTWAMERNRQHLLASDKNVQRRVERDKMLRKMVGAGYTPRLVWLYGVMLRGICTCTPILKVLNPPIGWGAGAVAAARFAHREWLPCILLGWFGSEWYWEVLCGVNGPPKSDNPDLDFDGIPITIHKVRFL